MHVHKRKTLISCRDLLKLGKAKFMNVIQHARSCVSIYWPAMLSFHQSCASYITFDKYFYNCDAVVKIFVHYISNP